MRLASVSILLGLLLASVVLTGCVKFDEKVVKISVLSSGQILLNGKATTTDQLRAALTRAKSLKGEVWYYRENASSETAPIQAKQTIQLIMDSKLPFSMSSKPDFSDYIDAQGQSHPREITAI